MEATKTTEKQKPARGQRGRPRGSSLGSDVLMRSVRFKRSTFDEVDLLYQALSDLPDTARITKQTFLEVVVRRGLESVKNDIFKEKDDAEQRDLFPLKQL